VTLQIGGVARRAHASGVALGGIRPELVFLRGAEADLELSAVAHRAVAFLRAMYCGEAILTPPVLATEFDHDDDIVGLVQLLWFMTTGDHPLHAGANILWDDTHERRHPAARQPWRGPPRGSRSSTGACSAMQQVGLRWTSFSGSSPR
jgi:hypothetical protein